MAPIPDDAANRIADSIAKMANANVQLVSTMNDMVKQLSTSYEILTKMTDKMEDFNTDVRSTVQSTERIHNAWKKISDLNRNLTVNKQVGKSYKDIEQSLKTIIDLTQRASKATKDPSTLRHLQEMEQAYKKFGAEVQKNGKVTQDAFNALSQVVGRATKSVDYFTQTIGKVEISRFTRQVKEMNQSFREAGLSIRAFDRLESMSAKIGLAKKILSSGATRRAAGQAVVQGKMAGMDVAGAKLPFDLQKMYQRGRAPMGATGKAILETEDYSELAKKLSGRREGSFLGKMDTSLGNAVLKRMAAAEAEGVAPGALTRMGARAMAGGEGSVLAGAAEGGAGAAVPAIAIGSMLVGILRKFIDTQAQTNQQIEKAMGGGLLAGGQTGTMSLRNVRNNLANPQWLTGLGISLERNLSIAQTMQEQGLDISGLATRIQGRQQGRGVGDEQLLTGSFGQFQRGAFMFGRAAGFSDTQTVEKMTKLLYEMRQSFDSTEDFLASLGKNARTAGISTTKYLSIIEELTSQFDKMNKSFSETVSMVQLLGRAGTSTADDLKDMANAITGAGEQKTIPQIAFAFQQMSPEEAQRWVETQSGVTRHASDELRSALKKGSGLSSEEVDRMDLTTSKGLANAQNTINRLNLPDDNPLKQNLMKLQQEAYRQSVQLGLAKTVQGGDFVGAAIATQATGMGATAKTATDMSIMHQIMARTGLSLGQIREHPEALMTGSTGAQAVELMKALGKKPEDLLTLSQAAGQMTGGLLLGGAKNLPEGAKWREYQKFFAIGQKQGAFPNIKQAQNTKEFYDSMDKALSGLSGDQFDKLAAEVEKQMRPEDFEDALGLALEKANKDLVAEQAKSVAEQTMTTADIFARAFEHLFTMILTPLQNLADMFSHSKIFGGRGSMLAEEGGPLLAKYLKMQEEGTFGKAKKAAENIVATSKDPQVVADAKNFLANLNDINQGQLAPNQVLTEKAKAAIYGAEGLKTNIAKETAAGTDVSNVQSILGLDDPQTRAFAIEKYLKGIGIEGVTDKSGRTTYNIPTTLNDDQKEAIGKLSDAADKNYAQASKNQAGQTTSITITQNVTQVDAMIAASHGGGLRTNVAPGAQAKPPTTANHVGDSIKGLKQMIDTQPVTTH